MKFGIKNFVSEILIRVLIENLYWTRKENYSNKPKKNFQEF